MTPDELAALQERSQQLRGKHPRNECPHRLAVIGHRPRKDGTTTELYRCSHRLNPRGEAVATECMTCGGAIPSCELCPFWSKEKGWFVYRREELRDPLPAIEPIAHAAEDFDSLRPRYVRQSEMIKAALSLLDGHRLPTGISMVAGVPRSGMMAAAAIATQLDVPLARITKEGNLLELGNGERGIHRRHGKLLIVDDTVYSGNQIKRIRAGFRGGDCIIAAIYANPPAKHIPDVYAELLPSPHFLEWNVFNGHMLAGHCSDKTLNGGIGLDLDGLLCSNLPFADRDDDDFSEDFERWCENAPPTRWRPQLTEIPLVITARLEKYRPVTLRWLDRVGMRVRDLVMHPAEKPSQRWNVAEWKASQLRQRGVRWFFESNTAPARELSAAWPEGYVLDLESGKFLRGGRLA